MSIPQRAVFPSDLGERRLAVMVGVPLSVLYGLALSWFGGSSLVVGFLPLIVLTAAIFGNAFLALGVLIISLFVSLETGPFALAVWVSLLFGFSAMIRSRDIAWSELHTPINMSLIVYGLSVLPSFLNASRPVLSFLLSFNIVAFLIVFFGTYLVVRSRRDRLMAVSLFVGLTFANAIHVIAVALVGGDRTFGFGGIMFVDYAGVSIVIAGLSAMAVTGIRRTALVSVSGVLIVALVFTQTRSIWLATFLSLAIIGVCLVVWPGVLGMNRRTATSVVVIAAAVVIGVGVMTAMANPDIGERAGQLTDASQHSISESGRAGSSLVTRALIWTTAWSAFQAHPWSGIGMFAFSYSSGSYRTIPRVLHDMYVRGLSPHQTHLAVLTETGMFGAVGFAFFMFACLRTAFGPFRGRHGHDTTREAVVAAGAMTYCFVSMFFTDAWLWGKGIVMLAIVVGIVCSIDRERSTGA